MALPGSARKPLTYGQLEGLWIAAGGPKDAASTMAAIAIRESGGQPWANNYHDTNGAGGTQTSWGLWQISNGTHSRPVRNINNPFVNAQQAVAKYRAAGLQPWGGTHNTTIRNVPPVPWKGGTQGTT